MSTSREETPWAEAPSSWSCRHAWPAPPSQSACRPRIPGPAASLNGSAGSHRPAARPASQRDSRLPAHGLPFSPTQREAGKRPREENTEPAQNWPLPSEQRGESVAFLKPPGFQGLLGPQIRPHLSLPLSPLGEHLPVPGGKRQQPLCPHSFSEHRQTDMYAILHLGHRSPHRNLC